MGVPMVFLWPFSIAMFHYSSASAARSPRTSELATPAPWFNKNKVGVSWNLSTSSAPMEWGIGGLYIFHYISPVIQHSYLSDGRETLAHNGRLLFDYAKDRTYMDISWISIPQRLRIAPWPLWNMDEPPPRFPSFGGYPGSKSWTTMAIDPSLWYDSKDVFSPIKKLITLALDYMTIGKSP